MNEYLMDGVELISTEAIQHYETTPGGWWVWVVAVILGILAFIGLCLLSSGGDGCNEIIIAFFIAVVFTAFFGGFLHDELYPPTPTYIETRHKVYVHDEVDYTEFVERFEVLEQNGDVYVVREKSED